MRILIADDDRLFRLLLGKTLTSWGHDPVVVSDGEQACEQLLAPSGPRAALLDWMMPKCDGLEVCRRVRAGHLPHYTYLILLTGKTNPEDLVDGLKAGADPDYQPKPINLKELELRLRIGCRVLEAEERHRMIAQRAPDAIVTVDHRDQIRFANEATGSIFGCSVPDLIGQPFSCLLPEFGDISRQDPPARSTGDAQFPAWLSKEMKGRHRDGREILLDVSISESLSESPDNSRPRTLTAIMRDITERRLVERQRAQTQKLESIGQLSAGIAHEINTPIQYIGDNGNFLKGAFEDLLQCIEPRSSNMKLTQEATGAKSVALLEPIPDVDLSYLRQEIPKAIEQLLDGVQQVARIVRAMKEFSHPGPVEKSPMDIHHAIESTILVSRNEWKHLANVSTEFDDSLPLVPCVAGQFKQVMLNLIVNAAHAIGEKVRNTSDKGIITIGTRWTDGWAEIRVSDTGTGIPEAIRSKVFDPFFTTKDVGKGTGQGLSLAHAAIVQQHQGTIDFESSVGEGTTFVIRLPLTTNGSGPCESD